MATAVIMPRQGQSVETCLVTQWFKNVGDTVEAGDILFAYETDKAAFDEESKVSGELLAIFFEAGDEVPVLENVCVIGKPGESFDVLKPKGTKDVSKEQSSASPVQSESSHRDPVKPVTTRDATDLKKRISPRARRKAMELGVSLEDVRGTGPRQRILEKDILQNFGNRPRITPLARQMMEKDKLVYDAEKMGRGSRVTTKDLSSPLKDNGYQKKPHSRMRQIIAQNMHRSLQQSAQLTHHISADARKLLHLRKIVKDAPGEYKDITLNDMVCYAVVRSLLACPEMNAQYHDDAVWQYASVHLGIAVHTERGLMVPTLMQAETYSLQELSDQLKILASACQTGHVDPDLLNPQSGTFTVSNLGAYGIELFTPVLNLPQVGILGVNTIQLKPVDIGNGSFGFVPHIGLSLTYDHRAIDGAPASSFLGSLKEQIESFNPGIE